jgi:hypothetical protein
MIAVPNDPEEPDLLMRAEDEIEQDTTTVRPLSSEEIQKYVKSGGLLSILRRNMSGEHKQPTVWLCRDSLDRVTFTFDEQRGLAGGRRVPFFALRGEKIFSPKVSEVVD